MSDTDDATDTGANQRKAVPRKRSPNFPGIALPKAIERAKQFYAKAQAHPIPSSKVIVDYWGYNSPTTGPASVTYAALKRYSLLTDTGQGDDRVARLTDLAVKLVHPSSPDRDAALQEAALAPDIFREWFDKYGADLPPDDSLHWDYVVNGPFAEDGLNTFLRVYRETLSYAKLDQRVDSPSEEGETAAAEDLDDGGAQGDHSSVAPSERPPRPARKRQSGVVTVSLPLPGFGPDQPVVIEFPGKLPENDWRFFANMVEAMKDGVVESDGEREARLADLDDRRGEPEGD